MAQEHIDVGPDLDMSHWPAGVQPISIGQTGLIGVDGTGNLYWDGKPVEVRKRLDLTWPEKTFAIIVGLATIAGSIGAVAQGWAAAAQWSCQTGLVMAGCPMASNASAPPVAPPQGGGR